MKLRANVVEQKIFEIEDLKELEEFLQSQSEIEQLRERLFAEFLKYADYKNAGEWNKAVRLCESLAIIGWGNHEPVEALRGQFFNGNPATCFQNKFGETRFVDAIWSKRVNGFTMEQGRTSYCFSPDDPNQKQSVFWEYEIKEDIQDIRLESQRNWIPKNPVWIKRTIGNCYENSKVVIESVDKELKPELDRRMRPEIYGRAINRIIINCSYSYYDHDHCKTNYIIADEKLKLKQKDFYRTHAHYVYQARNREERIFPSQSF